MLTELWVNLKNHVQRIVNSTTDIHGVFVADSGEMGNPSAADKLLRLGPDGNLHVTDAQVIGNVEFTGQVAFDMNPTGVSGGPSGPVTLSQLAMDVAALDLMSVRIKKHPVLIATAGQVLFMTSEPYQPGKLIVYSGGALAEGMYTEPDNQHVLFTVGRELGEDVRVFELQLGSDDESTVVDNSPSQAFLIGEVPSGTIDSTDGSNGNGDFVVAQTVLPVPAPRLFIAGGIEIPAAGWTRVSQTFTVLPGFKPVVGEVLTIYYSHTP